MSNRCYDCGYLFDGRFSDMTQSAERPERCVTCVAAFIATRSVTTRNPSTATPIDRHREKCQCTAPHGFSVCDVCDVCGGGIR